MSAADEPEICSQEPVTPSPEPISSITNAEPVSEGHEVTINNVSQVSAQEMDSLEQLFETSGNLSRAWLVYIHFPISHQSYSTASFSLIFTITLSSTPTRLSSQLTEPDSLSQVETQLTDRLLSQLKAHLESVGPEPVPIPKLKGENLYRFECYISRLHFEI